MRISHWMLPSCIKYFCFENQENLVIGVSVVRSHEKYEQLVRRTVELYSENCVLAVWNSFSGSNFATFSKNFFLFCSCEENEFLYCLYRNSNPLPMRNNLHFRSYFKMRFSHTYIVCVAKGKELKTRLNMIPCRLKRLHIERNYFSCGFSVTYTWNRRTCVFGLLHDIEIE